ncbi:non-ribosomal peptide synthetase [Solirubrobacter soli]|uniref:non-ribosomal peptide synthetase n=1 Tax=Solirubrobacter soli TaxID=363832 RepID=UPI000426746B|nr:non-ribosomal peptide synthetase [Solirubrobacter soli]
MNSTGAATRLHELVRAQAARTPSGIAVIAGEREVRYDELEEMAGAVAARLQLRGVGRGSLVGVCLERDEWLPAALLGVLMTGAAYVPLDPRYPASRLRFIAEDSGMSCVVTSPARPAADALPAIDTVMVGPGPKAAAAPGESTDPAYVIYTSGSTGRPKGVVVRHDNAVNLLTFEAKTYSAAELEGVLAATSVCFDPSVSQLFLPLITGGTVIMAPDLLALHTLPARERVTLLHGVPSVLAELLNQPLPRSLRTVLSGGEPLTRALADRIYANAHVERLVNVYGPTECTTRCVAAEVGRNDTGAPPIGRPYAGAELSVRDGGELWVSGPGVSAGYLGRPDLTAERFVDGAYRTGDLVRVIDGDLHFAGRIDDQVKVRGVRIELGEIEAALASHPAVALAVATAGDGRLRGYAEAADVTGAELRAYLREQLPDALVPDRVIVLDRIPLTPNGKADRGALPEFVDDGAERIEPGTDTERALAEIVAEVVGLPAVGVLDDFTEIGGHSLAAARVVARAGERFGVVVPLAGFLAEPTVAGLAARVETASALPPVRHVGRTRFPLTQLQRELWTLRRLRPESTANTIALHIRVSPITSAEPLRAALDGIVRRHEVLRTVFLDTPDGPIAEVRPPCPVPVQEFRGEDPTLLIDAAARHRFDLTAAPLMRATLIWVEPDAAELVLTVDHCAFDGYSTAILLKELAGAPNREPALQVGDLAVYEAQLSKPDRVPADVTPPELSTRPTQRARGARVTLPCIPADGATYLAAVGALLGSLTDAPETVVGVTSARRDRPGTEDVIGPLVSVLPVKVPTSAGSFRELERHARAALTRALAHQDEPAPALPVLLSIQPETPAVEGFELVRSLSAGGAAADLTFLVRAQELQVEYDAERFTAAEAETLGRALVKLLEADPAQPLPELGELVVTGPALNQDRPATVQEAVLSAARRTPGAIAVQGPDATFTYGELERFSDRLARALVAHGVRPGDIVGACLPRDHRLSAALLAIWRAGAAYLPLDPDHPAERMREVLATAGASLVVAAGSARAKAEETGAEVFDAAAAAEHDTKLPEPRPTRLAYVLFTSGSTGRPKGVEVTHANLAAFVAGMLETPGFTHDDAMLAVTSLSFDVAGSELWVPLAAGGRTIVVERAAVLDAHQLAERITATGPTVVDAPPTLLRALLAAGWRGDPQLRVITGGEVLDPALARELLPLVRELWNAYGPTETTINATLHRVTAANGPSVPIGLPVAGAHGYVADRHGRLVPDGFVGELWIGGAGVARGYAGRKDLTDAAFVPDPKRPGERCYRTGDLVRLLPDGTLDFVGRRDTQVKLSGNRIELGEVESVLREHPAVADAAVVVHEAQLVAYVVGDVGDLEAFAARRLPGYMVPRVWMALDALPTLPSGKVDRRALPEPQRQARGGAPRTATERLVAATWSEVLGRAEIGVDDSFFALGGNSFAATRVVGRLQQALGSRLPVRVLFEHPVLADFTTELERHVLAQLAAQIDISEARPA